MSQKSRKAFAKETVESLGGAPALASEMRSFQKSAAVFSAETPRLIEKYAQQWVAVRDGRVVASAATAEDLWQDIDTRAISRQGLIVRFIAPHRRTMIL